MDEHLSHSKLDRAGNYTQESLRVLCDVQGKQIDSLIQDKMFFEEEIRGIIEAARRVVHLRHTDNGVGLKQLIHAIRQTKDRCEARSLTAQLKRSQGSVKPTLG